MTTVSEAVIMVALTAVVDLMIRTVRSVARRQN